MDKLKPFECLKLAVSAIMSAVNERVKTVNGVAPDESGDVKVEIAAVPNAAGDTPTSAEFNALLQALRNAGLMAME